MGHDRGRLVLSLPEEGKALKFLTMFIAMLAAGCVARPKDPPKPPPPPLEGRTAVMTVARLMVPSDIAHIPPDDEVVLWDRPGPVLRARPVPASRKQAASTDVGEGRAVLSPDLTLEGIGFPSGSAALGSADIRMVKSAIERLGGARSIAKAVVYGRADDTGPEDLNMELSRRRAEAVKDLLIRLGIPAERIRTIALGETRDYPGDSEEARALNRSEKIVFYRRDKP
ncbi:MAG: OmpA family protein [Gammaproteobacteria bacterium]|nr:MAG: OmpA family protein [Gammaproteobacteria bacterium]